MINFKIQVYNHASKTYTDYTPFAVFPLKVANLLDEQLDEINLTLKGVSVEYFKPFTEFKIEITNKPDCLLTPAQKTAIRANQGLEVTLTELTELSANASKIEETHTITMVVANDRAVEVPVGSERYNHEIYLIEQTKILERFIGDSLTFTNPLGNNYTATYSYPIDNRLSGYSLVPTSLDLTFDNYKTPQILGYNFTILSLNTVAARFIDYITNTMGLDSVQLENNNGNSVFSKITIENDDGQSMIGGVAGFYDFDKTTTVEIKEHLKITYTLAISAVNSSGSTLFFTYNFYYFIYGVTNHLPLKKWTITEIINRIFDLIEPIQVNNNIGYNTKIETPRFKLQGVSYNLINERNSDYAGQADKYNQIIAPEFSFTRSTLREMLQQIGGFIHAEPRITGRVVETYANGTKTREFYEVAFDEYGSNEYSSIASEKYVGATFGTDINQYCTALDSSADNLTNSLDWAQGVIIEPYYSGYKSLRTEQTTARLAEDDSTYIPTQLPIHSIQKVVCRYIPGKGVGNWDITPYIFEASDYSTLSRYSTQSSHQGAYPFSKAFAIYSTYGQPNIKGLFFKAEHAADPVFHRYAIINILRAVTGNNNLDIAGQNLVKLAFNVTYKPLYSGRIRTHKQVIQDGLPSVIAYNQGANAIESKYYGEQLKGVVERLGNVEKTYTYQLAFLSQIPKVGQRFDNNYYISNVTYELLPLHIKCTVALSKHFNRISEYIGVNSQKRMWEISERQSQLRQSVYTTYIVAKTTSATSVSGNTKLQKPARLLLNAGNGAFTNAPVSLAEITTSYYNGKAIRTALLPVVSSAFGNSMTFTYAFEDNYSIGQKVEYVEGDVTDNDDVSGYWGANVPYTDYYGRFFHIKTRLLGGNLNFGSSALSLALPDASTSLSGINYELLTSRYLYRKDNKEIPQITHEIAVVTTNENIVIGSALCRNCSAVNTNPQGYSLYLLPKRLSVVDGKIDLTGASKINGSVIFTDNSITLPATDFTDYKAWALVTNPINTIINVEDEQGNETTQTITEGGELLIGLNYANESEETNTIYFEVKNKIN